ISRNFARRSSSASVSGSCWAKVFIGISGAFLVNRLRYHPRLAVDFRFDGTPLCAPRLVSTSEYRLCGGHYERQCRAPQQGNTGQVSRLAAVTDTVPPELHGSDASEIP